MGRTVCTEPQCLYSRAVPLLPLLAVRPVQNLSACKRAHITFFHAIDNKKFRVLLPAVAAVANLMSVGSNLTSAWTVKDIKVFYSWMNCHYLKLVIF